MKKGTQVAMAIGTGYLLGRRHKMRLAMMLGAGAMAGGVGGIGGELVKRGTKALGSADLLGKVSPQLSEISGLLRHDLLDAGKGAAKTAVNSRIDSLSDNIRDRADAWRNPAQSARDLVPGRAGAADEEEDEQEAPEEEKAASPRRSPSRARRAPRRSADSGNDREEGEEEARPVRRARSARGAASPVRRTRR
jgi:hypothetical protein